MWYTQLRRRVYKFIRRGAAVIFYRIDMTINFFFNFLFIDIVPRDG